MAGNTFTWLGGSGNGDTPGNWTPSGGPPRSGDTGIVNAGTVQVTDGQFSSNLLLLNAGTFQVYNTTETVSSSSFDDNTTLVAGTSGAAAFDVFGGFLNQGTIWAADHQVTVAIGADINSGSTIFGTLVNDGLIAVQSGATLDVTGGAGNTFQGGDVDLKGASALITATESGSNYTLDNNSTLDLDSAGTNVSVNFSGTADLLALMNSSALDSTINISDFASGDTLDIGTNAVGTIIYELPQSGGTGFGGSGAPILTIIGTNGGTILSDPFSGSYGNPVGNTSGTFNAGTLPTGIEAAGPFEVLKASNGDTLLELLPPSTWTWTGADPGNFDSSTNFDLIAGPGNQSDTIITAGTINGNPTSGDTVFFNDATIAFPLNNTLNGNTIFLMGTSEMSFLGSQAVANTGTSGGKPGISYQNPTLNQAAVISDDPPPATATLNFAGYNVNEGTLISNAGPGSSLTINVTQNGTTPGDFINDGDIEADPGNTVTIAIAGTSELFNADVIYANGGTIKIEGNASGIAGGYAPEFGGAAVIGDGGTIVFNAGFPSGTSGSSPVFAFYDGDHGDTLTLDQVGQFGGRILNFQQGDTIDLGQALNVGTIVVINDGRVLLENPGGSVLASLVLSTGVSPPGSYAVTSVAAGTLVAGGFTLTTGSDGDTLLTTNQVEAVWNNANGSTWQTAADWSTGVVPGATSAAVIGINPTGGVFGTITPFVMTTGATPVTVGSLFETSQSATLQITSATTVGTSANLNGIQQVAGEIEVTGGNTLTTSFMKQDTPGGDLQIDPGAVLAITGHDNLGFANNGSLTEVTVVNGTAVANGNTIGLFVTGNATVDDGTIAAGPVFNGANVVTSGGQIDIGLDGGGLPASMTVENGSTVTDTYAALSSDPTSFGALTITGAGTTWDDAGDPTDLLNTRGEMLVGSSNEATNLPSPSPQGTAQLVVENDATLNEASRAEIGNTADSAGSATIASGGVWNIGTASGGGFLNIGNNGSGTLDISGGTVNVLSGSSIAAGGFGAAGSYISNGTLNVNAAGAAIGSQLGSNGTAYVSGGGELNIAVFPTISGSGFGIGRNAQGELEIYDGGTVSISGGGASLGSDAAVADGTLVIGGTFSPSGTVVSSGGPSSLFIISGDTNGTNGGMSVGKVGTGTLYVMSGGTLQMDDGSLNVGSTAGSYGTVQVNGGLVENTTSGLNVGLAGTGTLDVLNSGTIELNGGGINAGVSAGAQGLVEIASGGMVTSTTSGANIGENAGSSGTLEIMAGGIYNISTHGISVGLSAGSVGSIVIAGSGARLNIGTQSGSFGFDIGQGGAGYLTVASNGTLSDAGAGINVGASLGSTGTVVVASDGLITTSGTQGINVGISGSGLLTIAATGTVSAANYFNIATNGTSSSGTVIVNGGTLNDNGIFSVGNAGSGTLVVEGSGLVDQTGINFNIGSGAGSTGSVNVNHSTLDSQGNFVVGGAGLGTLIVAGAGVVNDGTGDVSVGNQSGGTGGVNLSDGTLLAGGMQVGGFGTGTLTVTNESLVVLNGGTASGLGVGSSVGGFGSGVVDINNGTIAETGNGITVGGTNESGSLVIATGGELITTGTVGGISFSPTAGQINASGSGNAAVTVNGGTWIANGQINVAGSGSGALTIDGGLVNAGTNTVAVGSASGGSGTLTVGPGTLLAGAVQVAALFGPTPTFATGVMTIATGGLVDTGSLSQGSGGNVTVSGSLDVTGSSGISTGQSGVGPSALTVNSGGTVTDAGFLTVGSGGNGSLLVLSGGVVDVVGGNTFVLGLNSGGAGVVTVDGGILNSGTSNLTLGGGSGTTGAVTVESDGTLSAGSITVGNNGGSGAATVTGAGSHLTGIGEMSVGGFSGGTGSLLVQNQATVVTGSLNSFVGLDVATQSSSSGAVTVSGNHSLLSETGELIVGDAGLGNLSIQSGATVITTLGTVLSPAGAVIANQSGAGGSEVDVTGAGSRWQVGGTLIVGNAGFGSLALSQGATVIAGGLDLGAASGGDGVVSIVGTTTVLNLSGDLTVGDQSTGELTILSGALVTAANGNIGGSGTLSPSSVDIEGAGSHLDFSGTLAIGLNGPAVFTLGGSTELTLSGSVVTGANGIFNQSGTVDPPTIVNDGVTNLGNGAADLADDSIENSGLYALSNGTATMYTPLITFDPNTATDGGSTNGTWQIGNAGTLVLNATTVDASQTVEFTRTNGVLEIGQVPATNNGTITGAVLAGAANVLAGFAAPIQNFKSGDRILFNGLTFASDTVSGNTVTLWSGAGGVLGSLSFITLTGAPDSAGATAAGKQIAGQESAPCFAAGTRIMTARGAVAVEDLRVGDLVRTVLGGGGGARGGELAGGADGGGLAGGADGGGRRGGGLAPIVWVGRREVDCTRHPQPKKVWPVRVAAGAFGPGLPHSDLWLSPDHAVYVGEVLIPVRYLVNGSSIAQVAVERVVYHHVELPRHDVVLAEGLPAESFLDMKDGSNYANRAGPRRLYPDYTVRMWEAFGCAPLVVAGVELDAARELVAGFAAERGLVESCAAEPEPAVVGSFAQARKAA